MPRRSPLVAVVFAVLACAGCGLLDERPSAPVASGIGGWQPGPASPAALTEVAAAAHDGRIWVAGGMQADGAATDRVMVFDPADGSWTEGPPLPEPIHHSALVSDGSVLFLVGGFTADGRPTDAVRMLRHPDDPWLDFGRLPEPRGAGTAAWDGERMVYAGGVGPSGVSGAVYELGAGEWRQIGALSEPREHLAAATDGEGAVFVLGGRRGGLTGNLAVAEVVSGRGVRRVGELPTRRGGVGAFWWPSLGACLVGGESPGGTNAEVECIDADGGLTALPALDRPRHGLGVVVLNGAAWALLGGEQPGLFVSAAVERLALP